MKFFVLRELEFEDADDVTNFYFIEGSRMGPAPRCPICGNSIGLLQPLPPFIAVVEALGPQWGDIAFGPSDGILVSEHLKELFSTQDLRGFRELHPVTIKSAIMSGATVRGDPPEYSIASIVRSRTMLDEAASGLIREKGKICEACRTGGPSLRIDRIIVDLDSWGGEDIFYARGLPGDILVSERFRQMCSDNMLRNCYFTPAEEFGFDHYGPILEG